MVAFFYPPDDLKKNAEATAKEEARPANRLPSAYQLQQPRVRYNDQLNDAAWYEEINQAKQKPWNSTVKGRGMVRLLSRGVLGATAFAVGGQYARETMKHYNPEAALTAESAYTHYIAKGIDRFIGRPLEHIVTALGYNGKEFVTFRNTRRAYDKFGIGQHGITLGHEVVQMTADFAAASMGDAAGRDIADALDPNTKKNWIDEQGHIKYDVAAKNVASNVFKYLTYSQGEDWAVALPYVFYTRWQGNQIEKLSPGFVYDAHRRLNGGSFKVNGEGNVVGNYALEGAMDLQGRFTAYNIGTLMYREAYSEVKHKFKDWQSHGYQLSDLLDVSKLTANPLQKIGSTIRWAARDAIKATMYMTPAMPAFWMFRTPQTRFKGMFINPEEGVIVYKKGNEPYNVNTVHANEITRSSNQFTKAGEVQFAGDTPTFYSKFTDGDWKWGRNVTNPLLEYSTVVNPDNNNKYPAYEKSYSAFDSMLLPFGKVNNKIRKIGHAGVHKLGEKMNVNFDNETLRAKNFSDAVINASFAYTPYFFVKSDVMAKTLDYGKMDMAIERAIDGVTHFNGKELVAGLGEIYRATFHKSFLDPEREVEAQRRICADKSAADGQDIPLNTRCMNDALNEIEMKKRHVEKVDTQGYVERISDSKKRSKNMLDNFRKDEASKFADKVAPRPEELDDSFAKRELWKKDHNRDDFPTIGTTLH